MNLGRRIEKRLKELGLKQAELGRRAGVPQSTMNGIIRGDYRWSPHLPRIARELQTTPAYLVGDTDDPDSDGGGESPLSSEERELLELFRSIEPKERSAIVTLARSIATNARSPTIHDRGRGFHAAEPKVGERLR